MSIVASRRSSRHSLIDIASQQFPEPLEQEESLFLLPRFSGAEE